jgi:hypothetical protein
MTGMLRLRLVGALVAVTVGAAAVVIAALLLDNVLA